MTQNRNYDISDDKYILQARNLNKYYGEDTAAVKDVSLSVKQGEFLTLLGPSGSGKTTTLRLIAGFTIPTSGSVRLSGRDITNILPEKRDIGMVFQNYALFPHMTAEKNISFPLEMRHIPKNEISEKVNRVLQLVKLKEFGNRYPRQLSGGQQQRIAVARAVVYNPSLLLMDEPLGALDKNLREDLQIEIVDLKRRLNISIIYVTHDQEEALAMSDRIAIFNKGQIEQIGTGKELYRKPSTLFVARFMGESTIIKGKIIKDDISYLIEGSFGVVNLQKTKGISKEIRVGSNIALIIRPEDIKIFSQSDNHGYICLPAKVKAARYLGSSRKYDLQLQNGNIAVVREVSSTLNNEWQIDDEVFLGWKQEHTIILPDTNEMDK